MTQNSQSKFPSLPKGGYKAKDHEDEILNFWLENKYYKPEYDPVEDKLMSTEEMLEDERESWALVCPPPNAYGRPHVGNISGYAYMDVMARYQRMHGKKVLMLPGKDHAGLEGEGVFVREVLEKKKRNKFDMDRDDFYSEMMNWMTENMQQAQTDEKTIGLSADFDRDTFTLDPDIVETVLDTFVEMYNQGMIYKGVRIINYDIKARTAVADNQIEYKDAQTPFYYFKYQLTEDSSQVSVDKAVELVEKYSILDQIVLSPLRGTKGVTESLSNNHYNKTLKKFARENRKKQTPGEAKLWSRLRNKQFLEKRFLRQRPIDNYIVDFLDPQSKLIIEIDGASHDEERYESDIERQQTLENLGFSFLRFPESDIISSIDNVLQTIENFYAGLPVGSLPLSPSQEGGTEVKFTTKGGEFVICIGFTDEDLESSNLKGVPIGVEMRLDGKYRLVVQNPDFEGDLKKEIFEVFKQESKKIAGHHIILFDDLSLPQPPSQEGKQAKTSPLRGIEGVTSNTESISESTLRDKITNGLIIGTVRPETIFADTAIACGLNDERYKNFVGKEIEVEFLGVKKKLNFIEDFVVDKEFGTGLLKVTPAHAVEDWEIAQRNEKECLPPVQVIDYNLRMNHLAGKYEGMRIKDARKEMINDMVEYGNLVYLDEDYKNRVQIAERTKAPIEPLLSSQWYLKYDGIKEAAIKMVLNAHNDASNLEQSRDEIEEEVEKFLERSQVQSLPPTPSQEGESKASFSSDNIESSPLRGIEGVTESPKPILKIQEAQESDIVDMQRISAEGWHDTFVDEENGITLEKIKKEYKKEVGNQEHLDSLKKATLSSNNKVFVAKTDDKVIGWIMVENLENEHEINWIDVYIDREFRGQGIGKLLMNKAFDEFQELEFHVATPKNGGQKGFYEKFGFVQYPVESNNEYGLQMIQMKREPGESVRTGRDLSVQQSVTFHPSSMVPKFNHWMNNLRDWAISRSLWWGYRLPVWYAGEVKEEIGEDGQVKEYINLKQNVKESSDSEKSETILDLVRHGQSVDNMNNVVSGQRSDTPLSEQGIKDAENFQTTEDYDLIICSTLKRAKQTAKIINKKLNLEIIESDLIIEKNFGEIEGESCEAVIDRYPGANSVYDVYDSNVVKGSETEEQILDRLAEFSDWVHKTYPGKKILVVCHGGIKKEFGYLFGIMSKEELKAWVPKNLGVTRLVLDDERLDKIGVNDNWVELEYNNPKHLRVQKESPGHNWLQDENVLDTWFSSGQWVYSTLQKYGLMKEFFPTQVMVSGFDILENWISRMMMFTYFKKHNIPFENVYLTGLVKGTDGQKMSKSKGNLINIDEVREKYGTDAVRMVYYYQNSAGSSYAMTYEKLDTFKKFSNKIWNASKFVLMNLEGMSLPPTPSQEGENKILPSSNVESSPLRGIEGVTSVNHSVYNLQESDLKLEENKALLKHIKETKEHITKNIDSYDFGLATYNLYQAFWHEFADVHIEAVKKYTYTQRDKETGDVISEPNPTEKLETQKVLLFALKTYLKMLHPFMPFITERIWKEIPKEKDDHEVLMYSRW